MTICDHWRDERAVVFWLIRSPQRERAVEEANVEL
jgi:hypothetical protein